MWTDKQIVELFDPRRDLNVLGACGVRVGVEVVLVGGAGELEHTAGRHHRLAHAVVETFVDVDQVAVVSNVLDGVTAVGDGTVVDPDIFPVFEIQKYIQSEICEDQGKVLRLREDRRDQIDVVGEFGAVTEFAFISSVTIVFYRQERLGDTGVVGSDLASECLHCYTHLFEFGVHIRFDSI